MPAEEGTATEASRLQTRVRPFDVQWERDQLKQRIREVRRLELELADDDETGQQTEMIRTLLGAARELLEQAAVRLTDAEKTLREALGEDDR